MLSKLRQRAYSLNTLRSEVAARRIIAKNIVYSQDAYQEVERNEEEIQEMREIARRMREDMERAQESK